jgi:hypothetical protein
MGSLSWRKTTVKRPRRKRKRETHLVREAIPSPGETRGNRVKPDAFRSLFCGRRTSDTRYVKPFTWTFRRADEQLVLQRRQTADGMALVITTNDGVSTIPFNDPAALNTFQRDMEEVLVHTGWTLQQFSPERRTRDRRGFPRETNDRRRWWTDSVPEQAQSAVEQPSKTRSRRGRR